jgi:hypothetical protein
MLLFAAALVLLFAQKIWAEPDFDPEVIWETPIPMYFNILKFSPDDKFFYTRNDGGIHKFNSENGEYMGIYVEGWFNDFAFVEEYNWLICASLVGLQIRDMQTGEIIHKIGTTPIGRLDVSPDHSKIVFRLEGNMYIYSLTGFQEIAVAKSINVIDNKFINENEIVVVTQDANNYDFHIYSIPQNKYIRKLAVINSLIDGSFDFMQISPDSRNLITKNSSGLKFYDIETGDLFLHTSDRYFAGFSPNSKFYAISDKSKSTLYNFENHKIVFGINNDNYVLYRFLNKDNKHFLGVGNESSFKMLRFDFDSLATGVEIKEDIPVIYPNPTMDYVIIPNDGNNILKITISDYTGRDFPAIYTMETGEKTNSIRLNLTIIPSGTYFCNITGQNFSKTLKIMLEK